MHVNNRLLSFGYDKKRKSFFIRTTESEYIKMLKLENPDDNEIIFDLDESFITQLIKYFALTQNKSPIDDETFI